ncbi:MAG: 8-amino-7-oxononanoate synthase [Elusimicrobia bacterium]|nr:8-amino-7-oxononanoate synthase [Elusimicrobiota bacterium]
MIFSPLDHRLTAGLAGLESEHRRRRPRTVQTIPSAHTRVAGREILNFASNNYLGLAEDSRVCRAAAEAAHLWGAGATGSRLMGGTLAFHEELETALAKLKERESALVFPSGYHANLGMIPALAGPDDTLFLDRLAHASLVDGARLSKARVRIFRHNDPDDLNRALCRVSGNGERWVITESVFSMDGDRAPLKDLVSVCQKRSARLYVDEAHGTGVWGSGGRGWVNEQGVADQVDVCMGTLSKAFGAQGGFVCGSSMLTQWAINRARAFIYSTALSPSAVGASLAALKIMQEEPDRRSRLFGLSAQLWAGLNLKGEGPIVPLTVGEDTQALSLSSALWEAGIFAPAVRFPTVPKGAARVRFSVTANHAAEDIDRVLWAVGKWGRLNGNTHIENKSSPSPASAPLAPQVPIALRWAAGGRDSVL